MMSSEQTRSRGRRVIAGALGVALVGGLSLTVPAAANAAPVRAAVADEPASLVALYDFSEESGTIAHDASTHGNDATVVGGDSWNSGYMQFTGANHVKMPNDLLAGRSAATIVIETSPQALTGAKFLWNIGGAAGPSSGQGQFFIQPVAPRVAITKTNWSGEQTVTSPTKLVEGQWQSVAATIAKNPDGTTSTLRLFIDGAQVAEKTDSSVNLTDLLTHTVNYIGKSAYPADTQYQGKVSTFRVYEEALPAATLTEIAATDAASAATETVAAIDLAAVNAQSLDAVETNLTLPTAGGVTWTSSEPGIVAADGTVTQPESDTVVTLTAVSAVRGVQSTPRTFPVTVLRDPAASDKAQRDLDAISIADTDDIRSNFALPASGSRYGSALTWQSSSPSIVDVAGTAQTAPGIVTRPEGGDAKVMLTVTATIDGETATREIALVVRAAYDMPATTDYIFAHFTGTEGSASDEQIYFATSRDAKVFTDTRPAGAPVLSTERNAGEGEGGVRDPFLVRSPEGDRFYLIATDLSIYHRGGWGNAHATEDGSTELVIWESTDLVNWSEPRLSDVAGEIPNAGMAWAPEAIWDEVTGQYYVYWATRADGNTAFGDSVDIYLSTTRDFRTFSTPVKWIDREHSIIDTTVIKVGDWYYRASGDGEITIERSKNLAATTASALPAATGTDQQWVLVGTLQSILQGSGTCAAGTNYTGACLEGPEFFQYNDDDRAGAQQLYGLLADQYATGRGYVPFRTTDLASTSNTVWSKASDVNLGAIKKRHGGIVPITAAEYQRVMFHYAGVGADPDLKLSSAVTTRCVAGKVALAVSVTNDDSRAADVVITTPFGDKTVKALQAGKTVTQTVSTRQSAIAAASIAVQGTASDASYSASTFYETRTCG
ncbi:family 43 glycosylhydrolase [Microbacterium sp. LTA6]|uniref:immunoglobulin-like domain-containing protein n=1 Tax=Microbacterium sp. LTA6 TaxID=3129771 RepID=UPI0032569967